jgi:hypothetical protein
MAKLKSNNIFDAILEDMGSFHKQSMCVDAYEWLEKIPEHSNNQLRTLHCLHCGGSWPSYIEDPTVCKLCGSIIWNIPYIRKDLRSKEK